MNDPIETWREELLAAGWRPWKDRSGHEHGTIWQDPEGNLFRGPYGAWRLMQSRLQGCQAAPPETTTKEQS